MNSLENDANLKSLLKRLHAQSSVQEPALAAFINEKKIKNASDTAESIAASKAFWRDKMVALEPDKARFCYAICRALDAKRIVEAGTSFGVSTLYLAAAVRDNGGGIVIATEYEPEKAYAARTNFTEAGLSAYIDLREGDLRETLKVIPAPIDFMLMDIWSPMVRPAIGLVMPHMRKGSVVIADNTARYRDSYKDYFDFLSDNDNGFVTQTLPFDGGLEISVKIF